MSTPLLATKDRARGVRHAHTHPDRFHEGPRSLDPPLSRPGLCGLLGHAELPISCGYLPLLEQYSLTLSINYFVTQPCPRYTPTNSDPATLHLRGRHRRLATCVILAGASRIWDPPGIATSAQVGVRSKQVMNSPLNQYYVKWS